MSNEELMNQHNRTLDKVKQSSSKQSKNNIIIRIFQISRVSVVKNLSANIRSVLLSFL
jgi:hypothetical protein